MRESDHGQEEIKFNLWRSGLLFLTLAWVLALFTTYIHVAVLSSLIGTLLLILSAVDFFFSNESPD